MSARILASTALALALSTAAAQAQDWTGFYAGITVGGAFGDVDANGTVAGRGFGGGEGGETGGEIDSPSPLGDVAERAIIAPGVGGAVALSEDIDGAIAGFQVGYMWQTGNLVLGAELSAEFGDISYDGGLVVGPGPAPAVNYSLEIDEIYEFRVTAGTPVGPDTLLYGSLGYVSAESETQFRVAGGGAVIGGDNNSRDGYSVGVGVAHRLTQQWFLTAEFNYVDLGTETYVGNGGPGLPVVTLTQDISYSAINIGLNYRF